jgi:zinc transport system substrate-binding protein
MTRHVTTIMLLATGIVSISGCSTTPTNSATTAQTTQKLQIITTFVPITQFTKAVAGDRAEVTQLLPPNVGPHDYQAKPDDAQKLAKANVLVQNGLGMEAFLTDLIKNAGAGNLKTIDSSQGITPLKNAEEDDHDHAHDHGAEKAQEPAKAQDAHDHGEFNPHIWLDPKRAIKQVENIRDGLIAADPEGKAIYAQNAAIYIAELQALDREITAQLQPYSGKTYVTYHDFSPYFAQSYNLKPEFLVDIPESNPAPEDVKRVITAAQTSGLKTLLTEPQTGENRFVALAQDLNVKISSFDPIETAAPEALQPQGYLTLMRQNVKNLQTAFGDKDKQSYQTVPARPFLGMMQSRQFFHNGL